MTATPHPTAQPSDKPAYVPPRVMRLGDLNEGAGACTAGSGVVAVVSCSIPGSGATGTCEINGNSAGLMCNGSGSTATTNLCSANGDSALTICNSNGNGVT